MSECWALTIVIDHRMVVQVGCNGLDVIVEKETLLYTYLTFVSNVVTGDLSSVSSIDEACQL